MTRRVSAWWLLVFALAVVECYPFWAFPYFPSQDGPSHLYNALILADYNHTPIYREYYRIHLTSAGNLLTQLVLTVLVKVFTPYMAEKVLLTSYVILFPLGIAYFLKSIKRSVPAFVVISFFFVSNQFLHLGFWNFCFSVPVMLFALGYYMRVENAWTVTRALVFFVLTLVLYATHLISWAILALCVAIFTGIDLWSARKQSGRIQIRLASVWPLLAMLPSGLLLLAFAIAPHAPAVPGDEPMSGRLWVLYGLTSLHAMSNAGTPVVKLGGILIVLMAAGIAARRTAARMRLSRMDALLGVAAMSALLAVFGPERAASGDFIRERFAFYFWFFILLWLAVQKWPASALRVCAGAMAVLVIAMITIRVPVYAEWNKVLREFADVERNIPASSTVLELRLDDTPGRANPLFHAVDLFVPRPLIDLDNYEAGTDHFLTEYRPDFAPYGRLGVRQKLEDAPPVFDVHQYEKLSKGKVDYLLFFGAPSRDGSWPERSRYAAQLATYRIVGISSPSRKVRLYQRVAAR